MILYPRLERSSEIEALANDLADMSVMECRQHRKTSHPRAIFPPTGGTKASEKHMEDIAAKLTEIAVRHGYPDDAHRNTSADAEWAEFLFTNVQAGPHQASHDSMWHFFTVALVPDLVRWRWGKKADGEPASDRWVTVRHRGRNTFGRLWMRSMVLSDLTAHEPFRLMKSLGEDELVQIMERPSFAGNRRLSQASVELLLKVTKETPGISRPTLLREYQKRMLRIGAFIELQSLDNQSLKALCEELFIKSIKVLRQGERRH
jgi:Family of unknown function (DUF6339)